MIGATMTGGLDEPWPDELTHARLWDCGVHWAAIHTAPGVFDWDRLDAYVQKAAGRHLTYVIAGTPRWLAKHPDAPHHAPWLGPGANSVPWSMVEASDFLQRLVTRYKGRIDAYQVWNEPQLADFLWPWAPSSLNAVATLTSITRDMVRRHDPSAMVVAAAVLPRESSGGTKKGAAYWRALAEKRWPVDAFAVHLYPQVGFGARRWTSMMADAHSTLVTLKPPTTRMWVTETTYNLLGPAIDGDEARALVQATYAADRGRFVYWYSPNRPDLGGLRIATTPGSESAAWQEIKASHTAAG